MQKLNLQKERDFLASISGVSTSKEASKIKTAQKSAWDELEDEVEGILFSVDGLKDAVKAKSLDSVERTIPITKTRILDIIKLVRSKKKELMKGGSVSGSREAELAKCKKNKTAGIGDLSKELKDLASQLVKGAELIDKDAKDPKSDFSEAWNYLGPMIPEVASKLMKLKRQWNLK